MSTLHLANHGGPTHPGLRSCLQYVQSGDVILLYEDGVYAAVMALWEKLGAGRELPDIKLYVLDTDVQARGLDDRLHPDAKQIDYAGFVRLTEACQPVVSWP